MTFAAFYKRFPIERILVSTVIGLIGLVVLAWGARVVLIGGSPYFLLAGLAFLVGAILTFRASRWAYWAFAFLVLMTLVWAVSEVGLDWWQLFPRGNLIVV